MTTDWWGKISVVCQHLTGFAAFAQQGAYQRANGCSFFAAFAMLIAWV